MEQKLRLKLLSLFLVSGLLTAVQLVEAAARCEQAFLTEGIATAQSFPNLREAIIGLEKMETDTNKEGYVMWLPGLGKNYADITMKLDFKKGKFYAPIDVIQTHYQQIRELSFKQMVLVNGAHVVYGTFIPESYFGHKAKQDNNFPSMQQVYRDLQNQPFMEWRADGSIVFRNNSLPRYLFERLKENTGGKMTVYRGQTQLDVLIVDLLRTLHDNNISQANEIVLQIKNEVVQTRSSYLTPEVLLDLQHSRTPLEFADFILQKVRPIPYLFTTPSKSWAHYFAMGDKKVVAYELDLNRIPESMKDRLQLGADGNGSPPSNLEIGFPFTDIHEAIQWMGALQSQGFAN